MIAIAPTDKDWFDFLRNRPDLSTINFWTPTPWNPKQLEPGHLFYFLLKAPIRKVGGWGSFVRYENLTARDAWAKYGEGNGVTTSEELLRRVDKYAATRSRTYAADEDPLIGCIILENPVFLEREQFFSPEDYDLAFPDQVVKQKYYHHLDRIPISNESDMPTTYWVTVPGELTVNFDLAQQAGVWGVPADAESRLSPVKEGDQILFYGKGLGFVLCRATSEPFHDTTEVWPEKPYPHRLGISAPIKRASLKIPDIHDCLIGKDGQPYSSPQAAGRAIGGKGGIFRPLSTDEVKCLWGRFGWDGEAPQEPRVWWVNQGQSYSEEYEGGYVWAPTKAKGGQVFSHHKDVSRVQKGDVIVHYANGAVRALGEALTDGHEADRPEQLPAEPWLKEGYMARVHYYEAVDPIALSEIPEKYREGGPFTVGHAVKQGYLFPLRAADQIRRHFATRWPKDSPWGQENGPIVIPEVPTLDWLIEQTLWEKEDLEELIESLQADTHQVVLAGPPGTGKTWVAKHVALYLTEGREDRVKTVQFHPSFGYEEFIEGLQPKADKGTVTFEVVPGIVRRLAKDMVTPDATYVLVIDEMNRANLPRVFGELMYLLEYRGEENRIDLQYSEDFELPRGLKFIGTMNTADRSIRSIDIALRRRFDVFECMDNAGILGRYYEAPGHNNEVPNLIDGFEDLNDRLQSSLDRHHTIGQTFFMHSHVTSTRLQKVWNQKLGPLIEEYFFDQPDEAAKYSLEEFWPEA